MDTKLKNYRNLKVFIIGLVILLPSLAMMILRPHYIQQEQQGSEDFNYSYESISSYLVEAIYVLHGEEMQNESNTALTPYDIFFLFRPKKQHRPKKKKKKRQKMNMMTKPMTLREMLRMLFLTSTGNGVMISPISAPIWNTKSWMKMKTLLTASRAKGILCLIFYLSNALGSVSP